MRLRRTATSIMRNIIKRELEKKGSIFQTTSDTEVMAHLIARSEHDDIVDAVKDAMKQVIGGFAFLIVTKDKLIAALDPNGLRPFMIGRLGDAYLFASESCAFDAVGATYFRDVQPGEIIVIDRDGFRSERFTEAGDARFVRWSISTLLVRIVTLIR